MSKIINSKTGYKTVDSKDGVVMSCAFCDYGHPGWKCNNANSKHFGKPTSQFGCCDLFVDSCNQKLKEVN